MAYTLEIKKGKERRAWALLGEHAGYYGDNGADPDGNAWLPSTLDGIPGLLAGAVIDAGAGLRVRAETLTDEELMQWIGPVRNWPEDGEEEERLIAKLQRTINQNSVGWAHYGAYGTPESRWVYRPRSL